MPTKFESMIMDQYLDRTYGVADNYTEMATEMAGGTEPEGAAPMTLGQFAATAADVPAGILKGGLTGGAGAAGDIISIVRGIYDFGASGGDFDALLSGMQKPTGLPTTEDLKKLFDETLGIPLVPKGADPRRIEAAKTVEFVGEIGGGGEAIVRGTKAAARAAGEIGREMATTPPSGSVTLPTKLNNKRVGSAFDQMVREARQDFEEVMSNWEGGVFLNDDADKLITYPGRDQAFSRGKEGGKVVVNKKDMINWLMSEGPFDKTQYGPGIKNDKEYVNQIERLRSIVREAK